MPAYYNENDPKTAAWLRELIRAGHIAAGDVDERSIEDVTPMDIAGYNQCHFFAGIGGWSYALRLAGWGDERHVWTGSCPCQPFSAAGKGAGFADERHLWPSFFHLIRECQPDVIFGEQVANALPWFELVQRDLDVEGFAVGAAIIGAHSVGAPHIRQRIYWVADSSRQRQQQHTQRDGEPIAGAEAPRGYNTDGCSKLGNADGQRETALRRIPERPPIECRRSLCELANTNLQCERPAWAHATRDRDAGRVFETGNLEHTARNGWIKRRTESGQWSAVGGCEFLPCTDGKSRPVEPGTFPLAHGVPHRVGLLRGYGNAIVPQVAAAFIAAYADSRDSQ